MRIVPFPGRDEAGPDDAWQTELAAALSGEAEGAEPDFWRELRADVRATAPPMAPEFEGRLRARLATRGARGARGLRRAVPPERAETSDRPSRRLAAPSRRLAAPSRRLAAVAGLVGIVVAAVVVAVVLGGSPRSGPGAIGSPAPRVESTDAGARIHRAASGASGLNSAGASAGRSSTGAASSAPASSASAAGAESGALGRVQQRAATLSLSASPSEVQVIADRVARLATSFGGFVQSSQVQVLAPQEGTSRAELDLRLPSAKLSGALASLGQLAPMRSESQSLQDITNTYDAARQRLSEATAERGALLRALARASTEGEIDSLRERLAQARRAIAQAQAAFQAVSRRASTSEVEVTVLGDAHAASEGLTLHRGLHDAGKVLVVMLAALLIALAVLAPLALFALALAAARRAWRRYQRERVLDGG